jgi:hypothetical protein
MKKSILTAFTIILLFISANAQTASKNDKLKVFLDCTREWLCDFDFVRQEMKMVDFVRDRFQADVHVQVVTNFSSGGGEQNELNFLGLKNFSSRNDTLNYFNNATMTEDEKRKQLVKYLKLGLTSYYAKTSVAEKIDISYSVKDNENEDTKEQQKKDHWNFWQMSINASGNFNGDQNYKSQYISGGVSAGRETNKSRTNINISQETNKTTFTLADGSKDIAQNKSTSFNANHAIKLNEHWAAGANLNYQRSLFDNYDMNLTIRPRLEYSFTPYSKFNSERIIIQYLIGAEVNNYSDSTIYFKTKETQVRQSLNFIASFTKPWGSINLGTFFSHYMSDFKKKNISFNGSVNWKVFKGFNFGIGGEYAIVRDQINIKKGSASSTDVLTRRRALLSGYNYFVAVGFSYRFGSIFNSAVFPAMRGLNWSLNF